MGASNSLEARLAGLNAATIGRVSASRWDVAVLDTDASSGDESLFLGSGGESDADMNLGMSYD